MIVGCDWSTIFRLPAKRQVGGVVPTGGWGRGVGDIVLVLGVAKELCGHLFLIQAQRELREVYEATLIREFVWVR